MALYKSITTDSTTTLIDTGNGKGSVNVIKLTNISNTLSTNVTIFLEDMQTGGNPDYVILRTEMPPQTNLLLDEPKILSFNSNRYRMKILTATVGGDASIDIIIK
tara:strand:- start:114 stop:428 length:315 start_codon:yes stop_codon:yes gene_type:complete